MMFNMLEHSVETRYLINDPVQWQNLGYKSGESDFKFHWMTITKYFKNGVTGEKFVAISSWGDRFSINADLLKKAGGKYYSDFYAYKLQSEGEQ